MLVEAALMGGTAALWSIWFPVIKMLWTSTFVLAAAAYSLGLFAIFYYCIDVRGWTKGILFLQVIGMNSITIYLAQRIFSFRPISKFFLGGLASLCPETLGVLIISIGEFAAAWYFVYFLYKHKCCLKV